MLIDPAVVERLTEASDGPVCAYVYDLDGLRAHAEAAVAALPEGSELFYALKANSERPVIEALVGVVEAGVPAALALVQRCPHLAFAGFHFHCLSNHHDATAHAGLVAGYVERAHRWAAEAGLPVGVVNAGGGIGVDYAHLDRPFDW